MRLFAPDQAALERSLRLYPLGVAVAAVVVPWCKSFGPEAAAVRNWQLVLLVLMVGQMFVRRGSGNCSAPSRRAWLVVPAPGSGCSPSS